MTAITMEKHILKRLDALEDFAKEIRAALAAPATTPEEPRPFIPWSKEAEMLESWAAQPATAPAQPAPERKPMTEELIEVLYGDSNFDVVAPSVIAFARAVEAFHGIKEQP